MNTPKKLARDLGMQAVLVCGLQIVASTQIVAAEVEFDLPSSVEFQDITPHDFASLHPDLKVIEAKLRISARIVDGNAAEIVDLVYTIKTDTAMRVRDYLPKTTLESSISADQIEVTAENEKTLASGIEAGGVVAPLSLGGSHSQNSKMSESSHYKQLAPKDTVVASGTMDREHGVFYRIRPSRINSLEGSRDFSITVVVAKTWRGGLCAIECSARALKQTTFSTSVVSKGSAQAQVGMYLVSDKEAAVLAEELCANQQRLANLQAGQSPRESVFQTISYQSEGLFNGKERTRRRHEMQLAEEGVQLNQSRLQQLSK